MADGITLLPLLSYISAGFMQTGALGQAALLFSPLKIIFLIGWVYLCMYSIHRIEFGSLVPKRHKSIANAFGIVIGPFILFVLYVADTSKRIQEGEITLSEALWEIIPGIFKPVSARSRRKKVASIELWDTAGRKFGDVYGGLEGADSSGETLEMAENIVLEAIDQRASDILIDPKGDSVYSVRFRVDGLLRTQAQIDLRKCLAIVNSIKAISGMDIAEKRRPQDGAFMAKIPAGSVYFRVASAGVLGGEKLSIRILNQAEGLIKLDDIGFSQKTLPIVADVIKQSSGMVVICGPTGSGKTTTLYSLLSTVDFYSRNVITVEDPIEHVMPYVSQIEVNVKADITFANALRSILRQDPDVICVGEIRDSETAGMALQSSQTGHLVLATLHAGSNMGALIRLMDLGVKPLLLASGLDVIISQRLVRKLCNKCKTPAALSEEQIKTFQIKGINPAHIFQANGCKICDQTGYHGRTAILDVMRLDDDIKSNLLAKSLSPADMKKHGDKTCRSALQAQGLKKVLAGITTLEEVKRVVSSLG